MSIKYQMLQLVFEVWFCGMKYITDTSGELCLRWVGDDVFCIVNCLELILVSFVLVVITYFQNLTTFSVLFKPLALELDI